MSNYLSLIKCTWVPTRETKSGEYNKATHLWTLDFIYNNKKFITDNNLGNPGLIQSNTSGIRLKQNDNSEKYIIENVDGLIFIDIDNHDFQYWSEETNKIYIQKLHKALVGQAGYILSEPSKSGSGIHVIFYIPINKNASIDEQYKQYYVNGALTYNKIFKYLKEILTGIPENTILNSTNSILDFHNFSLVQLFALGISDNVLYNEIYLSNCDNFTDYCNNIINSYSSYNEYLDVLDKAGVHPVIKETVYKKLNIYTDSDKAHTETNSPINVKLNDFDINEFKKNLSTINPNNKLIFDYNNRLQLVWTLRNFFSESETIEIANILYDRFHNYDSKRANAYSNIKSAAKDIGKTPNIKILYFLKQFGIPLEETQTQTSETADNFISLEGTLINGNPADETIDLKDGFISDYIDTILQRLQDHQNLYIKAGCGTGKSTFYRTLLELPDENVCIICHLNSIIDGVYGERNTNKKDKKKIDFIPNACDDLFDISNDSILKNFNFDAQKVNMIIKQHNELPGKMVISWNSYQKLLEAGYDYTLDKYIKCFDESHNLIEQLNFRNSKTKKQKQGLISCILDPRWNFRNTIFCSGTPQYEYEFLPDMWKIEFLKKDPVHYSMEYAKIFSKCKFSNSSNYQAANIFINWFIQKDFIHNKAFDKILLFSNKLHKHLSEGFELKGMDICDFSKEHKDTMEAQTLIHNKNLNQHVFFSTIYGGQGIEIKNDIENLLCIFMKGDATRTDIIQAVHRFRNVKNIHIIIVETEPLPLSREDTLKTCTEQILEALKDLPTQYRKEPNYFATKALFRDNVDFIYLDVLLAMKFYNYKNTEYVEYERIHELFPVFQYIPISIEEITNNDISIRIPERERMEYEKFFTEYALAFFEYKGILESDAFLGEKFPYTKLNVSTSFLESRIRRDLQYCRLIKDMVIPNEAEYTDINLSDKAVSNINKIIAMWTLLKRYKDGNEIIGIENIFRVDKAYECLRERKRIHKHYVSSGSYLKPVIEDKEEIQKLIDIRQNYLKLAGEVGLDGVTENMYKEFTTVETIKLDSSVLESLKDPNWLAIDKYKTKTSVMRIGKDGKKRKKAYQLLTDESLIFFTLSECLSYSSSMCLVRPDMGLATFSKKHWRKFFRRV